MEEFVNPAPVVFGDAAALGFRVTYLHRFGAEPRMLGEFFGWQAIDFGL